MQAFSCSKPGSRAVARGGLARPGMTLLTTGRVVPSSRSVRSLAVRSGTSDERTRQFLRTRTGVPLVTVRREGGGPAVLGESTRRFPWPRRKPSQAVTGPPGTGPAHLSSCAAAVPGAGSCAVPGRRHVGWFGVAVHQSRSLRLCVVGVTALCCGMVERGRREEVHRGGWCVTPRR